MNELIDDMKRWRQDGQRVGLARVVGVLDSTPGTRCRHGGERNRRGYGISFRGCAEGAVVDKALQVIESGEPRLGTFGYSHDDAIVVGPFEARWPPHQRPKGASTK